MQQTFGSIKEKHYFCVPFTTEGFNYFEFNVLITVTKADVIAEISSKTGIDKKDVSETLENFFQVVKNNLANQENIYVRGFGSFINKKRAKKIARNISKNTSITIDEHYVPSFKPAKVFVEQIKTSTDPAK
jgi:DNA-binding protein HU-beta